MTPRNNCMQNSRCSCAYGRRRENAVNICNTISVFQSADASGGNGGNGGSNGSAASSASAAAASADRGGLAIARNEQNNELDLSLREAAKINPTSEEESLLQNGTSVSASASSGAATIGSAGNGGAGGNGGDATNSASAEINNVVVLTFSGDYPGASYNVGINEKKLDIKIDDDGIAYVNGKKMEESTLDNGTKVYIFSDKQKNNENKL